MKPTNDERVTRDGYTIVPNQILDNPLPAIVGTSAAWLYLILLRYENEGVAWPSWDKLCKQTGFSRQTISTALSKLQECGIITEVDQRSGPHNTNRYHIGIPTFEDDTSLKIRPVQKLDQSKNWTTDGLKIRPPMVQKLDLTSTIVQVPGTNTPHTPKGDSEKDSSLSDDSPPVENSNHVLEKPSEKPSSEKRERNYKYTDQDVAIVDTLEQYIRDSYKASWKLSAPKEAHYNEMRLLRENGNANIDGPISIDRIRDVMRFLRHDTFWLPKGNIRSVSKLREKFDVFEMKVANTKDTPKDDGHTPLRLEDL